jgi:hypothetical protein
MRSGASKCALASITLSADCNASELGAPWVSSKKHRTSQRRKPLARIGQVSRWPLMSRSAKPVPSGAWNSSAAFARSIRMSACFGPRPPGTPLSSAIASSIAVTRHPAFFNCARSASKAARSSRLSVARRSSTSAAKTAPGSETVLSRRPSSGSRTSSTAAMAARTASLPSSSEGLIARPPRCKASGAAADR